MTLTGLEAALVGGCISTVAAIIGASWKSRQLGDQCEKCGIDGLKAEIRLQSKLIRRLCEESGITVKEQLEIEAEQ